MVLVLARLATRAPILELANRGGPLDEEVRVERKDDVGLGEVVARLEVPAESEPRAGAHLVAPRRLPLVPLRLRLVGE